MYLCIYFIIPNSFYHKTQKYIRNLLDLVVKILDQICADGKKLDLFEMEGHVSTISIKK